MGLATRAMLGVLAALPSRAQSPPEPLRHLRIQEGPNSILEAAGARVVRTRDGATAALGCTDPGGTGAIRDLALDPAGRCFVAAERGLFVLAPEVDALDRVELREGAPPGTPTSVFVDRRRRVWLATDRAFGVLDASFFWGRTIQGAGDDPSDELAHYVPDAERAPALTAVSIDGVACAAGQTLRVDSDAPLRIVAAGTGAGGATFRWRLDRHHVWRDPELEPPETPLAPGEHLLEVVAIDRDLNRSPPFRVPLLVAYPRKYEPRVLVPVAGIAALALIGISVFGARRRSLARGVVGGLIAVAVLAQIVAGLVPHAKAWPFVGFSMYSEPHAENAITYDEGIVGIDPEGRKRWIDDISLGSAWDNRWQVLGALLEGGEPAASAWLARYARQHPDAPLVGLQVCARRRRLTPDGPVPIAPLIFGVFGGSGATR